MSDNLVLMNKNQRLIELNEKLGFTRLITLEDCDLITAGSKKELIKKSKKSNKQYKIFKADDEEMLRFALEKTKINAVFGQENIFSKESVHFNKSGLDQILCKIAARQGKIIIFSFAAILNSKNISLLMGRIRMNIKLCQKYHVKHFFANLSKDLFEMRSAEEISSVAAILGEDNKNILTFD